MKVKLEDVLNGKERELKLYERFLNLKTFYEEEVFPEFDLPLKHHIETLKGLIEKIIPDPKDRTEEMFSGEIFALLGTLYMHDVKYAQNFEWRVNREILRAIDTNGKEIFMNYEIGKRLDIPESAIEIINYLSFSHVVKKYPAEWEIVDNDAKALIRNTKIFESIFNFAHLLVDIFYTDIQSLPLKRYTKPQVVLRPNNASIDIDSKEGIITIRYAALFPYELHALESARRYVDNMFIRLKNNVNGRLGFQYREIVWDITGNLSHIKDVFDAPKFSSCNGLEGFLLERREEGERILDTLFDYGYTVVVGDASAGKTTVLKSYVMPQLVAVTSNVFYCEIWSRPTSEIRGVINRKLKLSDFVNLDVISLCKKLSDEAPCFIIFDSMEKLALINMAEREKFERFFDFCMSERNIYLIICGDKEGFFEWYPVLHGTNSSALCQIKPIVDGPALSDEVAHKPTKVEPLGANSNLERVLENILSDLKDLYEFRSLVASFVDRYEEAIRRYTIEEIYAETLLPQETILAFVSALKEKDIIKETETQGRICYSLTNRHLRGSLHNVLKLNDFEERRKVRTILRNCVANETFLDDESLILIDAWKDRMIFGKDEMGLILGSLIARRKDYENYFEKAKKDGKGIDIQPVLKLIYIKNADKRAKAIKLLIDIQDKDMINPLLLHLKEEDVFEIKDLLVKGIGLTGKKKAIIAIMNTLREIGDKQLRLDAIDFFHSLFGENAHQVLIEIRETEEDPSIIKKIDQLLLNQAGSV